MFEYLTAAVNDFQDIMNVVFQYHDVRMPHQVTVEFVRSMIKTSRCQRLIVSVGQWPAGKHFRVNADVRGQSTGFTMNTVTWFNGCTVHSQHFLQYIVA